MTAAPIGIDLKGLGLKGLFRPDGSPYRMVPEEIERLPSFWRTAAAEVWTVLMKYVHEWGELDERLITSKIAEELSSRHGHRCESFVFKGLYALQYLARVITRVRKHGRRVIVFLVGLLGQERQSPAAKGNRPSPPQTPPEENQETTTTRDPSSSLASLPGEGQGEGLTDEPLPDDLAAAVGLVPDLSAERIRGWIRLGGLDLARRALAWLRIWKKHPRAEKRPQGAFWAERALLDWKKRIDRGELTLADIDAQIEAKKRKWEPRTPALSPSLAAAVEPQRPLTAEEVSSLLEMARSRRSPAMAGQARRALCEAIQAGMVPPELVATIPPELASRE